MEVAQKGSKIAAQPRNANNGSAATTNQPQRRPPGNNNNSNGNTRAPYAAPRRGTANYRGNPAPRNNTTQQRSNTYYEQPDVGSGSGKAYYNANSTSNSSRFYSTNANYSGATGYQPSQPRSTRGIAPLMSTAANPVLPPGSSAVAAAASGSKFNAKKGEDSLAPLPHAAANQNQMRQQSVGKVSAAASGGDPSATTDGEINDEWETASDSSLVRHGRVKSHSGTDSNSMKAQQANANANTSRTGGGNVGGEYNYANEAVNTSSGGHRNQYKAGGRGGPKAAPIRGSGVRDRQYGASGKSQQHYDTYASNNYESSQYAGGYGSGGNNSSGRQRGAKNNTRGNSSGANPPKPDDLRYTAKYWTDSSNTTTSTTTTTTTNTTTTNTAAVATTTAAISVAATSAKTEQNDADTTTTLSTTSGNANSKSTSNFTLIYLLFFKFHSVLVQKMYS